MEDFFYLNQSGCYSVNGIDDKQEFIDTKDAMVQLGFYHEEIDDVVKILGGILHLGNLTFKTKKNGSEIANMETLKIVSELLGIEQTALVRCLTTKTVTAGGRQSVYNSELDVKQAEYARDALAKSTYSKLFDWVVKKINAAILKKEINPKDRLTIGILDIYGFEIFEKNSFEQLCINYVNEKLQQVFIELTLKAEQEEYNREGIKWEPIPYENNKPCVELIEKKIGGLFALLNETCLMSGDDNKFLEKVKSGLKTNNFFLSDEKKKTVFGLKHYAGEVWYSPEGFTDKNSDQLFQSIVDTLKSTKNALLKELFADLQQVNTKNTKNQVSQRPTSVSTKFVTQVDELMIKLYACNPHYIRCLKPNSEKRANYFVDVEMKHQVRYLGLLENVKVRRAGFCFYRTFDIFFQRFCVLSDKTYPKYDGSVLDGCKLIMEAATKSNENYQFGKSKIFIKIPETVYHLEDLRDRALEEIVKKIQATWRKYKARKFFIELKEKALGIFGEKKKRRKISVNRVFAGDYLQFGSMVANQKLMEKHAEKDDKIIFSNYGSKVSKTVFGYGAIEFHPKIIVMTEKTVLLFAGTTKKATFKEKFDIATIEFITLSPAADNFVYIKTPLGIEYLMDVDSKTEFVSLLSEMFEKANKRQPNFQFLEKFIFYIKKKIPLNVSVVVDDKCVKSTLKHQKTDLIVTVPYEPSMFGNEIKKRSDKISAPTKKVVRYEPPKQDIKKQEPVVMKQEPVTMKPVEEEKKIVAPRQAPPKPQKRETTLALYDFTAEAEEEISFKAGDEISIINKGGDGWWEGEVKGKKGLFPANYCQAGN